MSKNKDSNFFIDIWNSITNFEKYKEFANRKTAKVIKYIVFFILLYVFIITFAIAFFPYKTLKNGLSVFEKDFPDLQYSNGILNVNVQEPLRYDNLDKNNNIFILVDTNANLEEQENYMTEIKKYKNSVFVFSDRSVVKTELTEGTTSYLYKDIFGKYNIDNFDKQDILNNFFGTNSIKIFIILYLIFFSYALLTYIVLVFMDVITLSVIAFITNLIYKVNLKYINCVKIAIYALTLPLLLQLIYVYVNMFTGFKIDYFGLMYNIISYIYVITAIILMRNDMAKQDVGLSKEIKIEKDNKEEIITNEDVEKEKNERKKKKKKVNDKNKGEPDVGLGQT